MEIYVIIQVARQLEGELIFVQTMRAFRKSEDAEMFLKGKSSQWSEIIDGVQCRIILNSAYYQERRQYMKENAPHNPLEGEREELTIPLNSYSADDQVSIIVVHKDRPGYLNMCLQSISITSVNNSYELIVVDNGSTEQDTHDYLDQLEKEGVKVIRNEHNLWWSKAANQGAKVSDKNSKYFIFMHSDVIVEEPTWIDLLINVAESQDSGMVGVSMSAYKMRDQKIDFVQEYCVLISRECWDDCGPFSEELPQVGAPFVFTLSAQQKGHKPQVIRNKVVHHYKIFGMDVSEFERFAEQAMVTVPKLLRELQS
jgi:hypothetical protein